MVVSFDGVTLQKPRIEMLRTPGTLSVRKILDGRFSLTGPITAGFEIKFKCFTTSLADVTNINSKYGIRGTLAVGATNYLNMMLVPPVEVRPNENYTQFFYYVTLMQDTVA